MYCKNCGYKNDTDATFCERCGSKLYNQVNKVSKSKSNPLSAWWSQRDSKGQFLIIIISLLIFLIIVSNFTSGKKYDNEETVKVYGNDSGTFYSGDFFSFSHLKMDKITLGDDSSSSGEVFSGYADPKGSELKPNYTFLITVYKPVTANKSAYEHITSEKNANDATDSPTYPIKSIEIAGVTGYQYDYDYTDTPQPFKNRDIFFVKNGLLYQIHFTSDLNKMDRYKQDIDTIVNSFTVK